MSGEVYLTRAGYQRLYSEFEALKVDRVKISRAIEEARLQGDISENAEYDAAKDAQAHNAARISDMEGKLARVRIIEDEDIPFDKVYIGAIVTVKDLEKKQEMKYMLVSPEEAVYEENKLSIFSPVGKGLMGLAVDEEAEIHVPAGVLKYKVLKIERP
ncbi:MAG: transcription elongation factor GreA, partial [Candidatus Omnitrophica bacterium]|nr:transcription elongation factor GreA [Candidatus Omnitrophota bacterium]MBU4333774.1 transcription elongation factor GreA [Candidatus Omnitrophota bacterium]